MKGKVREESSHVCLSGCDNISSFTMAENHQDDQQDNPKQPRDMKGLLNFCLEATAAEDAPSSASTISQMEPERRAFLEAALNDMVSTDPVQEMKKAMTQLEAKLCNVTNKDSPVVQEIVYIVDEVLMDILGSLDYANDFYKLGGKILLEEMLRSSIPIIRIKGCDLIAETVQNNPVSQAAVLDSPLVTKLTELLDDNSQEENVRVKALYAISCLIRDNPKTPDYFDVNQLSILIRLLDCRTQTNKLRTKACFLLSSLASSSDKVKEALVKNGLVQKFISILKEDHDSSHEYVASALRAIVSEHEDARRQCADPQHNLKSLLDSRIESLSGDESHQDEVSIYQDLKDICFSV